VNKLVNLTPHTLNVLRGGEEVMKLAPSGQVARVSVDYAKTGELLGVELYTAVYGDVEGLPAPQEGTFYVVSGLVKAAVNREDVLAPGALVRDENGRPKGCEGLKC